MKKVRNNKLGTVLMIMIAAALVIIGCGRKNEEEQDKNDVISDNILITETGEVIEKSRPRATPAPSPSPFRSAHAGSHFEQQQITTEMDIDIPVQEQVVTEEDQTKPEGHPLQLVFLGDSIFDNNRDGTGVPYLTSKLCDADVYNLAIGGTSASIEMDEEGSVEQWTSRSFCGVVNAMLGLIPTDIFEGTVAKELLDDPDIDFTQTDYFIVQYGINDFFRGVRQSNVDYDGDNKKTYVGAMRYGIGNLTEVAPDATVIVCSPMFAQFYKDGHLIGDSNMMDNGSGTLADYVGTCNYIANETQSVFFNAYLDLGIDAYTAEEYLEDGVHLTEAGRRLYAEALAKIILDYEETKNN